MPIKPENKAKYPDNWDSEIRPRILERAGNCCEKCGVPNHAIGWRDERGEFHIVALDGNRQRLADEQFSYGDVFTLILIVLTVAHVDDPDPANCDDANLAAWCQRCHNRHDAPMRRKNAAMTRHAAKGCDDLFAARIAAYRDEVALYGHKLNHYQAKIEAEVDRLLKEKSSDEVRSENRRFEREEPRRD